MDQYRDKKATPSQNGPYDGICQNLHCRTPNRSGYYSAGPALPGTDCAMGRWCLAGACVSRGYFVKPIEYRKGGWSEWTFQKCESACLVQARGYAKAERLCNSPEPINTDEGCEGLSYGAIICKDENVSEIHKIIRIKYSAFFVDLWKVCKETGSAICNGKM